MSEERRKNERRRWGRKVTYPFIDSDGVLVTKNRRRKIDRRDVSPEEEEALKDEVPQTPEPAPVAASKQTEKKTSISISNSKVMELEEALQDDDGPESKIETSIKDLENEILEATGLDQAASAEMDVASAKEEAEYADADLPEIDLSASEGVNKNEVSVELSVKGEKHLVNLNKDSAK